jgi:hypothetical protein
MFLEYHPADKSPHFNLYGELDGKLILMTKDHIHAKAFGGEDRHSNFQTMCLICNNLKSHSSITLEGVRALRAVYDENKEKVNKKKLHLMIEEVRATLDPVSWPKPRAKKRDCRMARRKSTLDALRTTIDLNVYRDVDTVYANPVYDAANPHQHIGCIRKGTWLEPLVSSKSQVLCKLTDADVVLINQVYLHAHKEKKDA